MHAWIEAIHSDGRVCDQPEPVRAWSFGHKNLANQSRANKEFAIRHELVIDEAFLEWTASKCHCR